MKALAILALVFASLSIFIPLGGILLAVLCSIFALITFRTHITLSGITFGLNIINTAFLTPSLFFIDDIAGHTSATREPTEMYFAYLGIHITLFALAILWRLIRGAPKQQLQATSQTPSTTQQ